MKVLVILLIGMLLLNGCGVQSRIVDDISLATVVGFDYINDHEIKKVMSRPKFNPDKTIENKIYSAKASLIRESKAKLDAKSSRPILNGKLAVACFNTELAQHGLFKYIDYLVRDPDIGSRVALVIAKNKVETIINPNNDFSGQDAGIYLSNLIEQNEKNSVLPKTNLHTFYYQYYSKGMDPYLPMVSVEDKQVAFSGIALFKSDKYVGEIPFNQMFTFNLLAQKLNNGVFPIHKGDDSSVIENIQARRKVRVFYNHGVPKAIIRLYLTGIIREYKGEKITPKKMDEINHEFKTEIKQEGRFIIKKLQKLDIDPIGFSEIARHQNRGFNSNRWDEHYQGMNVSIVVQSKLTEFGIER